MINIFTIIDTDLYINNLNRFIDALYNLPNKSNYSLNILAKNDIKINNQYINITKIGDHLNYFDYIKYIIKESVNKRLEYILIIDPCIYFGNNNWLDIYKLKSNKSNSITCRIIENNNPKKYNLDKQHTKSFLYSEGIMEDRIENLEINFIDLSCAFLDKKIIEYLNTIDITNKITYINNRQYKLIYTDDIVSFTNNNEINNNIDIDNRYFTNIVSKSINNLNPISDISYNKNKTLYISKIKDRDKRKDEVILNTEKFNVSYESKMYYEDKINNIINDTFKINNIYIYTLDNKLYNNIKQNISNLNINIELIDRLYLDKYNFDNSIFINLTDEFKVTWNISSISQKCCLITTNSNKNNSYYKCNYNALIVDIKQDNILEKIDLYIKQIMNNKNFFEKMCKNLYISYLKHKDDYAIQNITDKRIKIDRSIYKPLLDRKKISPFQIGILYKDIDKEYALDLIGNLIIQDSRLNFALSSNNIYIKDKTLYYEKDFNIFKNSVCSIILGSSYNNREIDKYSMHSLACGCPSIIVKDNKEFDFVRDDVNFIVRYENINSIFHILKVFIHDKTKLKNVIEKGYIYISKIIEG